MLHHPGLGPRYGIPDLTSGVEQGLNGLCYRNEQVRKTENVGVGGLGLLGCPGQEVRITG